MEANVTISKNTAYIIQNEWGSEIPCSGVSQTSSSVEVPVELAKILQDRIESHLNLRNYLHFLLNQYRLINYSGSLPKTKRIKTRYQENGEKEEFSFRPFDADWAELKLIALAHGLSAVCLFVVLLKLDASEFGNAMKEFISEIEPAILLMYPIEMKFVLCRDSNPILTRHSQFGTDFYVFNPH